MQLKKAAITVGLTSMLFFSVGSPIFANATSFSDIESSKGVVEINALHDRGIIQGVTASEFKPNELLTNAQAVQLITRAFQLNLNTTQFIKKPLASDIFKNVGDRLWYSDAFVIAHYNGLEISNEIDPKKPITKEEFTYLLMQAVEKTGKMPVANLMLIFIADQDEINTLYDGAVQLSIKWNVNVLDEQDKFNPKAEITRSESASMLFKTIELLDMYPER